MTSKYVTKYKWFWAWNDDKEEAWLSNMSRDGLHLKHVSLGSYRFEQGEPEDYVYRLDYRTMKSKEKDSYLQLFEDAGWEHVGEMNGWVYFRIKSENGEAPEIYSDSESKKGKYGRILIYLVIFLPIFLVLRPKPYDGAGPYFVIIETLWAVLILLYATAMIQLMKRISQLRDQRQ